MLQFSPMPVIQLLHPSPTAPAPVTWTCKPYAGGEDSEGPSVRGTGHRQKGNLIFTSGMSSKET